MLRRARSDVTIEKALREALANKGLAKSQIQILNALLKLCQVCCGPRQVPLFTEDDVAELLKPLTVR